MSRSARSNLAGAITAGLLSMLLAACGGSSQVVTRSPLTHTTTNAGGPRGASSVETGRVHAVLRGPDHHPIVGKKWIYTLKVTDAHGHPLRATIDTEFALGGSVVGHDTPPTHFLANGAYKEALKFPASSLGYPIELQVVVHTKLGSVTLDWPVTVRK